MKILLAEDERRMAEALLELLRQEGYDVDWFANGIEALWQPRQTSTMPSSST